jgi:SAM-dependent methyltransferase
VSTEPYYQADLARIHHLGFGFHADACAPGIIDLLDDVLARDGLVLEVGCGSGLLTKHLLDAGHRVIATDASPAMLDLARETLGDTLGNAPGRVAIESLTLPDDPVPEADAIVSVGHALSYLPDAAALDRALVALAGSLRPGGVMAIDLCDLEWGRHRRDVRSAGWVGDDWGLVTQFPFEGDDRYIREMTTFTELPDGTYRRSSERHDNVLVDTSQVPGRLASLGLETEVRQSFGAEDLPIGLVAIVARRPA